MTSAQPLHLDQDLPRDGRNSNRVVRASAANELVFAVVGHVGSGTSTVCEQLQELLLLNGFDASILKASDVIEAWAARSGHSPPPAEHRDLGRAERLQDLGDLMRKSGDVAAVARELIKLIRETRASKVPPVPDAGGLVMPDGKLRAYILDSVRHPAEVYLLRNVYQSAFALIGVVCDEEERISRLTKKFFQGGQLAVKSLMARDRKAKEKHGQRVDDAFHLSDYFLDNSAANVLKDEITPNPSWDVPDQLSRLIKIVTHKEIVRPSIAETAMYAASGAMLRSACLSRQVGAALVDREGNLVATGTNEAPKAGGGVYGQGFDGKDTVGDVDGRCAYYTVIPPGAIKREEDKKGYATHYCSNTREQNKILEEVADILIEFLSKAAGAGPQPMEEQQKGLDEALRLVKERRRELVEDLRGSRIRGLIEFSRAIHAEMDALLSAARQGISPVGTRMFVTTFPCHACARHLVSAGVDEVQYIEPYPKSKALALHPDAITTDREAWMAPSERGVRGEKSMQDREHKVLFRPFVGVAPRLYTRAFLKDRDLKDDHTGTRKIGEPEWGTPWNLGKLSYVQLEAELVKEDEVKHG